MRQVFEFTVTFEKSHPFPDTQNKTCKQNTCIARQRVDAELRVLGPAELKIGDNNLHNKLFQQ